VAGREGPPATPPNRFAIGCLLLLPGLFGGGMVGALVAKVVGNFKRCVPPEGFPACEVWQFVLPGAAIGAVLLPALVLWRVRSGGGQGNSARS
jgi:hypothetical protein